eukprot:scaffold24.g2943.t1
MGRRLLISVDNSDACEGAVRWAMDNCYRPGDEASATGDPLKCRVAAGRVHLLHVIPRLQLAASFGAPPVDFLPYQDPNAYQSLIKSAEAFIAERALAHLGELEPAPVVHLVKYETDTDSIGNVICKKADELDVALVVMARHQKSKLQAEARASRQTRAARRRGD